MCKKTIKISVIAILCLTQPVLAQDEAWVNEPSGTFLDTLGERKRLFDEPLKKRGIETDLSQPGAGGRSIDGIDEVPIRDPFNYSSKLNLQQPGRSFGTTTFLPNNSQNRIPELRLKGIINQTGDDEEDLLALLEVNKKDVYMVRVGDEISYDPTTPSAAIKIQSISRLSITVQVGSLGNVLIVR